MARRSFSWPSDQVIEAAQSGDPVALEALILGSHPHVARFASSLCATREDAEEAAQDALTLLYRRVGTLRVAAALSGWAFQVVKHECSRRARAALRRRETDHRSVRLSAGIEMESAEEALLGRLEAQRVALAIASLPPSYQRVLVLRDLQSLPGAEVARRLGMSRPAMKSTFHRARTALREALEGSSSWD